MNVFLLHTVTTNQRTKLNYIASHATKAKNITKITKGPRRLNLTHINHFLSRKKNDVYDPYNKNRTPYLTQIHFHTKCSTGHAL